MLAHSVTLLGRQKILWDGRLVGRKGLVSVPTLDVAPLLAMADGMEQSGRRAEGRRHHGRDGGILLHRFCGF